MELNDLNPQQQQVVKHGKGPLLVVAGAGTGKTAVITRRIAHLVESGQAKPDEILALTFTDKAAFEMEERVDRLLPLGVVDVAVMTFNSFGHRLLEEFGIEVGLPLNVKLITRTQQVIFLTDHFDELKLKYYAPWSNPTSALSAVIDHFSKLRNELINPKGYLEFVSKMPKASPEDVLEQQKHLELANAYQIYENLKRRFGLVDYDDQVSLAIDLLTQRPNIARQLRERYKYILVDEFQDTNKAQNRLLELLAGSDGNLMVVGDDDQSIYKFRGAAISNILAFQDHYPKAKPVALQQNYRSTQAILDFAYNLIVHNNPDRLEAKYGLSKQLTGTSAGSPPSILQARSIGEEAGLVAQQIRGLLDSKVKPSEIAILLRKRKQADHLEVALRKSGVPYRLGDNQKLHLQSEIEFLLYFLQYLIDPHKSDALFHLLEHPIWKFDLHTLSHLAGKAKRSNLPLDTVLRQEAEGLEVFWQLTEHLRKFAAAHTASEVCYELLSRSGFLDQLEEAVDEDPALAVKFANLDKWFDSLTEYQEIAQDKTAKGYLESLGNLRELADLAVFSEPDLSSEEVNILTIHQAKGLEFAHVFLFDFTQEAIPGRRRPETISPPSGLAEEEVQPEGDWRVQEERRLAYVAMTRAKTGLTISFSPHHGMKRAKKPSIFLSEALGKKLPEVVTQPQLDLVAKLAAKHSAAPDVAPKLVESKLIKDGWLHLTPHQIDDYLSCPYNFRYLYLLEVPQPISPNLMYGSMVHEIIRQYWVSAKLGKVDEAGLVDMIDQLWSPEGFASSGEEQKRRQQATLTVKSLIDRENKQQRQPEFVEKAFRFEIPEVKVTVSGRYDAVYTTPEVEIRDYKTSMVEDSDKADTKAKKSIQLAIYALAWQKATGEIPAKVVLDFVETGQLGVATKTEADMQKLEDSIIEASKGIRAGEFPTGNCQYCLHRPVSKAASTGKVE